MAEMTSLHVRRAIAGDAGSVEWLVAHFLPLVTSQVRLRLRGRGTPQDVEDLTEDVWLRALQTLPDLVPREGRHAPVLVRFLGETVLRVCNNFLRSQGRRARLAGQAVAPDHAARDTRGVVSRVQEAELGSVVGRCLQELEDDKRRVLVLRIMEQRSNREIASMLGVEPNTVAVRYRRALEKLRQELPRQVYREMFGSSR